MSRGTGRKLGTGTPAAARQARLGACALAGVCVHLLWDAQLHHPCELIKQALTVCRYSCYYLTRNSLTYTAPVMVSDPALKMDITQARIPLTGTTTERLTSGSTDQEFKFAPSVYVAVWTVQT